MFSDSGRSILARERRRWGSARVGSGHPGYPVDASSRHPESKRNTN